MHPIMAWIWTSVLLMTTAVFGEETHTNVSGSAGSTFHLTGPKGCLYKNNMTYELQHGQDVGGWYDDGKLTIFRQFEGRLEFDKKNCTFIIRNVTSKDSGMYTITGRYMENDDPKTPKLTYNVTVIDHVTSTPFPSHMVTSQGVLNLTACNKGFPAACISLAPLLNCALVYLLPRGVSFLHGRIFRTQDRTQDRTQYIQNNCLFISGSVSLVCQFVSISLWLVCGILNNSVWFGLAICCTAILGAAYIYSLCKCLTKSRAASGSEDPANRTHTGTTEDRRAVRSDCLGCKVKFPLLIISFILQLSFPACVVFAFYRTHGEIFVQKIWVFFTFAVVYLVTFSLPCLEYIVYRYYCCPKTTEDADAAEMEQMNPSENDSSIEKTEKSPPSPV